MWLLACTAPVEIEAEPGVGGIEVRATAPIAHASWSSDGRPGASVRPRTPSANLWVPGTPPRGRALHLTVELASGEQRSLDLDIPALPVWIEVELPAGRAPVEVHPGDTLEGIGPPGARARIRLTALEPCEVRVADRAWTLEAAGSQAEVSVPVGPVVVEAGGERASFATHLVDPGDLGANPPLELADPTFPTDRRGRGDRALPADRVVLPGPLAEVLERRLGWGWRPRHDLAPWGYGAVTVRNPLAVDLDVALSQVVGSEDGEPAPGFAPPSGSPPVSIVRVPARGTAVATLPVWVDPRTVRPGPYLREVRARPLGLSSVDVALRAPLVVERAGGGLELGFLASLAVGGAGLVALWRGAPRFLARTPVRDQVTVGLFGAATFVVGGGFQLVGYALAALLGPFAPFASGLFDDAFRAVLLATLLQQCPRVGVLGAATVVGFLMRALALGSFHPADLVYLGTQVLLGEAGAWVVGLTRDPSWVDGAPIRRWVQLSAALAPANAMAAGLGLASTAVLYRLWWAPAYVAALVALPGFLYVVVGCRLAVPVADSLKRVAP